MSPHKPLRVAVTGCNGKVGVHAVDALLAAGHEVVGIDRQPPGRTDITSIVADLTDYGQTFDALGSIGWDILGDTTDHAFDVVVHLAAIPHPRMFSNAETFTNNVTAAYNVFEACRRLGLRDIVLASSETVLGVPFDDAITYLPLDEHSPRRGRNAYGLSKLLIEQIAEEYAKNDPDLRVTALRLSYVQNVEEYAEYPDFADDLDYRIWDLWSYIDGRDTGTAVEKALHSQPRGFETFLIVADDTAMPTPAPDLVEARFPNGPVKGELDDRTLLLSNQAAKQRLGFHPQHSWCDHVPTGH
ncbi:NAD-dependent epimerase/dehydratase family protein [Streptomyces sp. NPDC059166]|uniref:NAD-dependent epimerase/dehydratase family protein n=1 Tax=Streptomyces sp. NPDC059166 TaxID=3346752 RepID=UPI00368E6938